MRSIRYMRGTRRWKHGFRGYPKKYRKRKKFYIPNPAFDLEWLLRNIHSNPYFGQPYIYPSSHSSSLEVVSLKDLLRGCAI